MSWKMEVIIELKLFGLKFFKVRFNEIEEVEEVVKDIFNDQVQVVVEGLMVYFFFIVVGDVRLGSSNSDSEKNGVMGKIDVSI